MHSEPVPKLEKEDRYRIVRAHVRLSLVAGEKERIVVVLRRIHLWLASK